MIQDNTIVRNRNGDSKLLLRVTDFVGVDCVNVVWPAWETDSRNQTSAVMLLEDLIEVPILEQLNEAAIQFKTNHHWQAADIIRAARTHIEHLTEPQEITTPGPVARLRAWWAGRLSVQSPGSRM